MEFFSYCLNINSKVIVVIILRVLFLCSLSGFAFAADTDDFDTAAQPKRKSSKAEETIQKAFPEWKIIKEQTQVNAYDRELIKAFWDDSDQITSSLDLTRRHSEKNPSEAFKDLVDKNMMVATRVFMKPFVTGGIAVFSKAKDQILNLHVLSIGEDYQQQGIGSVLLKDLEENYDAVSIKASILSTSEEFYNKKGFVEDLEGKNEWDRIKQLKAPGAAEKTPSKADAHSSSTEQTEKADFSKDITR